MNPEIKQILEDVVRYCEDQAIWDKLGQYGDFCYKIQKLLKENTVPDSSMTIQPINDNNSRFDLVEVKSNNPKVQPTPHCKIHGAMNCVAIHETGRLWRCIQSCQVKDCRAGCEQVF